MKNRIGIVGGGQLARMLCFEAKKMGFTVSILDPTPNSPAGQVADKQIVARLDNKRAMRQLAEISDFITIEWELADDKLLKQFEDKGVQINPSSKTLRIIKDKLLQKQFLQKNKIPVADFISVDTREDIISAAKKLGYPLVLKARFDAYDGRGNAVMKNEKGISAALKKLKGRKLYVEKFVPFEKELAVMIARSIKGAIVLYPVVETIHKNNILHIVKAPAQVSKIIQRKAKKLAESVLQHLHGAGVFGVEMFLTKKGEVLVNEIAPRVHNSGHYTMDACFTSQFEQHIRAITGMPLGNTAMLVKAAVMINILGQRHGPAEIKGLEKVMMLPNVSIHIYGKAETKLERKMGHITAVGSNIDTVFRRVQQARRMISI